MTTARARTTLAATALASALAACCLALNVAAFLGRVPEPFFDHLPPRFWQDVHIAQALYLFGEFPVSANQVMKRRDDDGVIRAYEEHPHLSRTAQEAGIPPWRFWEVVRENRYRRSASRVLVDRFDDSGRPLLLGLGFKALGGISPWLMFWLGALLAVPLLAWTAWELAAAGRPVAGVAFVTMLGLMPFLADSLALPYSTAGFHVLAVLVTVPLAVYALLAPRIAWRGCLLRALAAGVFLAVCVLARGGAALTLAGPLGAAMVAAARLGAARGRRHGALLLVAALAALALPYAVLRVGVDRLVARTAALYGRAGLAPQRHAFWFGMWTGLGDHDRTKGYQWLDAAASAAVVAAGGTPLRSDRYDPANEAIFRRLILDDVAKDPAWYAGILLRRLWGTAALVKLWPWPPLSGRSIASATSPNEGGIDSYYTLTTPADRWGLGDRQAELPIPLVVAPALVVLALAVRRGRTSPWREVAALLALVAVAVLPLPLLVGTGGAVEPQAFVFVYCLALALLIGWASPRDRARGSTEAL